MSNFPVPAVQLINNRPCTTSLAIGACFGKQHAHVLRDIEKLTTECPKNFAQSNFGLSEYTDSTGRKLPMYHVFFDGFILLVMGYTDKKALQMKLAYIEAFNAMREKLEKSNQPLAQGQQAILQAIIDALVVKASASGKLKRVLYAQIWNSFRGHFGLGKKDQLPQARMNEAITFLVQLELGKRQKSIPDYQDGTERIDSSKFDRMRKQIIEDLDQIDKKLGEISSLVKWQLSPTSRDAGFTQEKMNFFYMMLHLNNMALGGIYTARQALAIAGKMRE